MASNITDQLKESTRQLYLIKYGDLPDDELRQIVLNNARKAVAMPAVPASLTTLAQLNGESEACNQILQERQRKRDAQKKAKKEWNDNLPSMKEDIFRKLPAAVSPNGQLIAAVLEDEDGLTQAEIAGFCDELSEIPEEDLSALLEELVKEKILVFRDDRYYLLDLCTPSLYPDDPVEWNLHKYQLTRRLRGEDPEEDLSQYRCLLTFLKLAELIGRLKKPFTAAELTQFMKEILETGEYDPQAEGFTVEDMTQSASSCDYDLRRMFFYGLLDKTGSLSTDTMYYYHMLGAPTGNPFLERTAAENDASRKKLTLTQQENIGFQAEIEDLLSRSPEPMTIEEIKNASSSLVDLSNQRAGYLIRQMKDKGILVQTTVGRRTCFSLAPRDGEASSPASGTNAAGENKDTEVSGS